MLVPRPDLLLYLGDSRFTHLVERVFAEFGRPVSVIAQPFDAPVKDSKFEYVAAAKLFTELAQHPQRDHLYWCVAIVLHPYLPDVSVLREVYVYSLADAMLVHRGAAYTSTFETDCEFIESAISDMLSDVWELKLISG